MLSFGKIMIGIAILATSLILFASSSRAVAPSEKAIEKWKAEGRYEEMVGQWRRFKADGGCSPAEQVPFDREKHAQSLALGTDVADTVYVCVIMVDFDDNPASGGGVFATPADFNKQLFSYRGTDPESEQNPTGSMTDFYMENSYDQFYIKGDIFGWYRAPEDYSYYVVHDTIAGLPPSGRADDLARDACFAARDAGVDFSKYDSDNDGNCDGLIIIHAGPGAETGASNAIWSHKSSINVFLNGVAITNYTMNPEEYDNDIHPIGVYAHEYGHFLGLPDLYDIDYLPTTSSGLGRWSLMATGSYNGDSRSPAHLDAWCKQDIGFLSLTWLDGINLLNVEIPCVEYNPVAYRLRNQGVSSYEYWVVENRQKVGFDSDLPSDGLLIYHVDTQAPEHNSNHLRYHVALEQADGNNGLALLGSLGDAGDPFPGATLAREFHDRTVPDSRTNLLGWDPDEATGVGVWNISDSDSLMYADLDSRFSRPWPDLSSTSPPAFDDAVGGDGDGRLEAGETVYLTLHIHNFWRTAYNGVIHVACDNPGVEFLTNDVPLVGSIMGDFDVLNTSPVQFRITAEVQPMIDTFWVTVTSDSLSMPVGSAEFSTDLPIEVAIGGSQVLIVDDDRGDDYESVYEDILYSQLVPYETWSVNDSGVPSGSKLIEYPMVFWHTGDSSAQISSGDIAALKYFMDARGNLLLSTNAGVYDLASIDSQFMADYFGAAATGESDELPMYIGVDGSRLGGDSVKYRGENGGWTQLPYVTPMGIGEPEFLLSGNTSAVVGVTVLEEEGHRSVLLSFAIETMKNTSTGYGTASDLISDIIDFFEVSAGIHTDVDDGRGGALPGSFTLGQNYPNPFNPTTTISYTLRPIAGSLPTTNLAVFNLLGQRVVTLVNEAQLPGIYTVNWDGRNQAAQPIASGVYFYRLSRGDDSQTRKMILLK